MNWYVLWLEERPLRFRFRLFKEYKDAADFRDNLGKGIIERTNGPWGIQA